ncbi:MAG: hypothetical protein U0350_45650 [Caldilineaceae bacterium]
MKRFHKAVSVVIAVLLMVMPLTSWQSDLVYAQGTVSQAYQPDTLYGAVNGKSWSPSTGTLIGSGRLINGVRYTEPKADVLRWTTGARNYMLGRDGTPAITFHTFRIGGGCSAWAISILLSTNLPSPTITTKRAPNTCLQGTQEIRVKFNKQSLQLSPISYFAQVQAQDQCTNSCWPNNAKVTVDTYWVSGFFETGEENYHQHYCVTSTSSAFTISGRNSC